MRLGQRGLWTRRRLGDLGAPGGPAVATRGLFARPAAAAGEREAEQDRDRPHHGGQDTVARVPLSPTVRPYDHVLLDIDGCLWAGGEVLDGAVEAVAALREAGKAVLFLTNDTWLAPEELVRRLWRHGFKASLDEVLSAGAAMQFWLAQRGGGGGAYVIGSQALVDHVAEAGLRVLNRTPFAQRADVVVVASHAAFDYDELKIATQAVLRGAELIGAHRDATFPMPDGAWPASGAVLAAVEAASGRRAALTVGKPEPPIYAAARDRLGPGRTLAVGDRPEVDVLGAQRAGLDSALLLAGAAAEEVDPRPTHVAESLAALVLSRG
jgi:HAD superfamily hydrolase (TIGR01450 family)